MKRQLAMYVALCGAIAAAGCAGSTEPATNVLNVSAQLNAKGYTNDGPATWWWEYDTVKADLGTASDTEVCGNGTGPKEPDNRCGPAAAGSASNQIPLNVVVNGLTPNTTYYFRACGQDTNDPGPTCANTRSFQTLAGTGYAFAGALPRPGTAGPPDCRVSFAFSGTFNRGLAADASGLYARGERACGEPRDSIWKFSPAGQLVLSWGSNVPPVGNQTFNPSSVATGPGGRVYTGETAWSRVRTFSSTGTLLGTWGDGQVSWPIDLDTDTAGNVYVTEFLADLVQKFTSSGGFVTGWGFHELPPIGAPTHFSMGIAVDRSNNVYVGIGAALRIQKFTSTGTFVTEWGSPGAGDGQFGSIGPDELYGGPADIATDSAGYIYAADPENHRIQKFAPDGTFITKWGTSGTGPGQLEKPQFLTVDPAGNVYVVDTAHQAIQKFSPTQ